MRRREPFSLRLTGANMLDSAYLRDAARLVQSPISVKAMPDGSFTITQKVAGLIWECSDTDTARAIYTQVRRNYLALFRTQD